MDCLNSEHIWFELNQMYPSNWNLASLHPRTFWLIIYALCSLNINIFILVGGISVSQIVVLQALEIKCICLNNT